MKERPILMNAAMVRAVLVGRKTQTRRIMKPQPEVGPGGRVGLRDKALEFWALDSGESSWFVRSRCPFGGPGDRLWVRETFRPSASGKGYHYPASLSDYERAEKGPWTPSIHMPRAASRIDLEVTVVRVERLQDITEEDARAEGVESVEERLSPNTCIGRDQTLSTGERMVDSPFRASFAWLWDEIYGDHATWKSNPWVWVVSFGQVEAMRGRGL